jgi:hypothetical protein
MAGEPLLSAPVTASWITDDMRAALGRELSRKVSFPVSASDIRRWVLATWYPSAPPRRFWELPDAELQAPEEFNPFAWMTVPPAGAEPDLGRGGYRGPEHTLGLAPPATTSMINGGRVATYGEPMRPGDVITSVNRLTDYFERDGRLGLMLFTKSTDTWTNQHGDTVKTEVITYIRY